ncbi:hypothetical protein FGO68_gene7574 [Halteria grandinella]|uniref:Uncharacterized protein n=1 Tax=Halteria grandinella TaxID=5974 RepID=A0A8J8NDW7_HALGN|nr:hypothetical protein FGO68_gene7574 [Halteria grandinella]
MKSYLEPNDLKKVLIAYRLALNEGQGQVRLVKKDLIKAFRVVHKGISEERLNEWIRSTWVYLEAAPVISTIAKVRKPKFSDITLTVTEFMSLSCNTTERMPGLQAAMKSIKAKIEIEKQPLIKLRGSLSSNYLFNLPEVQKTVDAESTLPKAKLQETDGTFLHSELKKASKHKNSPSTTFLASLNQQDLKHHLLSTHRVLDQESSRRDLTQRLRSSLRRRLSIVEAESMAKTLAEKERAEEQRKKYAKYLMPQSERLKERIIGGKSVLIKKGILMLRPPVIKRVESQFDVETQDDTKDECDLCTLFDKPIVPPKHRKSHSDLTTFVPKKSLVGRNMSSKQSYDITEHSRPSSGLGLMELIQKRKEVKQSLRDDNHLYLQLSISKNYRF